MESGNSRDDLHVCPYCGKSFMRRSYLSCHMIAHKSPALECDACHRQFGRADSLRRHRCPSAAVASTSATTGSTAAVRPHHACPICPKTYARRESLLQHVVKYHQEMLDGSEDGAIQAHPCTVCRRVFASALSLHNHEVLIHGGTAQADSVGFSCAGCGRQFASQLNVDRHVCPNAPALHTNKGVALPKQPTVCKNPADPKPPADSNYLLDADDELLSPQQSIAGTAESKRCTCEFCGRTFSGSGWLRRHVAAVHPSPEAVQEVVDTGGESASSSQSLAIGRGHVCPVCGKSLSSTGNLNKHLLTHGPPREKCCECGRRFHQRASLRQHIASIHGPPGSFAIQCPTCGLRMRSRNSLYSHVARFHRAASPSSLLPHVCEVCGRGFHQRGNLRKHERTHNEDAPYLCPDCPRRLRTAERLRRHQTWHQCGKQFACADCGQSFVQPSDLRRHIAFSHSPANDTYRCCYCGVCCRHYQTMRRHLQRRHADQINWQTADVRSFINALSIRRMKLLNTQTNQGLMTASSCSQTTDIEDIQVTEVPLVIGAENNAAFDSCVSEFLCASSTCLEDCIE